jgi:hypothetical protein
MRNVFLAAIAVAALTIGTSTARAEHARRPAYCAPSYGVGYPAYSVRTYTSYRHSPAYGARYSIHGHSPHHSRVQSYGHSVHYGGYGRPPHAGHGHGHGHSRQAYSPYGSGAHIGVHSGRVSFHIGF